MLYNQAPVFSSPPNPLSKMERGSEAGVRSFAAAGAYADFKGVCPPIPVDFQAVTEYSDTLIECSGSISLRLPNRYFAPQFFQSYK